MTDPRTDFAAYKEEVGRSLKATNWPMTDNFGYEAIVSSLLSMLGMRREELLFLFSRLGGLIDPTCVAMQKEETSFCGMWSCEMDDTVVWCCSMCRCEFPIATQDAFEVANSWESLVNNPYDGREILRCDVCGARVTELCYLDGHSLRERACEM